MKHSNWPPNQASSIHFISLYYALIQISQFQSLFIFSLNCYLHQKQLCFVIKSHCQNGSNKSIWRGKRGLHLLPWHCRGVSNKNSNPKHKHLSTTVKYINVQINNIKPKIENVTISLTVYINFIHFYWWILIYKTKKWSDTTTKLTTIIMLTKRSYVAWPLIPIMYLTILNKFAKYII